MRLFLNRLIKFSENYTNEKYTVGSVDTEWVSVAYGNGVYVAVGDKAINSVVGRSTDGKNWTTTTISPFDGKAEYVAYCNNNFILFVRTSNDKVSVRYSSDGTTWGTDSVQITIPNIKGSFYGYKVHYYTTLGIVGGDKICFASNNNGRYWGDPFSISGVTSIYDIIYTGTYNVIVGANGKVYISSDGRTNTYTSISPSGYSDCTFKSVAYGNGKLVIVGTRVNAGNIEGVVLSTTDYENWTEANTKCPIIPKSIAYGDNKFVICGYKTDSDGNDVGCIVTTDGLSFSNVIRSDNTVWNKVIYSNDEFLVIGDNGSMCNLTF